MHRLRSLSWLPLFALLAAGSAYGDPQTESRDLFKKGKAALDAGRSGEALQAFQGSYKLSNAPSVLFFIAEAYRASGDEVKALETYQEYLAKLPEAPKKADAEARIAELKGKGKAIKSKVADAAPPKAKPADLALVVADAKPKEKPAKPADKKQKAGDLLDLNLDDPAPPTDLALDDKVIEAKAKAKAEADAKAKADAKLLADAAKADQDAKQAADAKAKADAQAQADAQAKLAAQAKADADAKARAQADAQARQTAQAKADADAKARAENDAKLARADHDAKQTSPHDGKPAAPHDVKPAPVTAAPSAALAAVAPSKKPFHGLRPTGIAAAIAGAAGIGLGAWFVNHSSDLDSKSASALPAADAAQLRNEQSASKNAQRALFTAGAVAILTGAILWLGSD